MTKPFRQRSSLTQQEKGILFFIYDNYWGKSFKLKDINTLTNNYQFIKNLEMKGFATKKCRVRDYDPTYLWELTKKAEEHIKAYRSGVDLPKKRIWC